MNSTFGRRDMHEHTPVGDDKGSDEPAARKPKSPKAQALGQYDFGDSSMLLLGILVPENLVASKQFAILKESSMDLCSNGCLSVNHGVPRDNGSVVNALHQALIRSFTPWSPAGQSTVLVCELDITGVMGSISDKSLAERSCYAIPLL